MTRKIYERSDVRYDKSDDYLQSLLRFALYEVWDGRCHWCGDALRNPAFAEIDHVIPETKYSEFLVNVAADNDNLYSETFRKSIPTLPDSPHEVGNLAPICYRDNRSKNATIDETTLGPINRSLKLARRRSGRVTTRVMEMVRAKGISASFVDLLALPGNEETNQIVKRWGEGVIGSLWRFDKQLLESFRVPREIELDLDEGVLPDWFEQATRTGTGIDGLLDLSVDEHVALEGAAVLYEFNDIGASLSAAIKDAVEEADAELEQDLQNEGVVHVDSVEPRWATLKAKLDTGSEPRLEITVQMTATLGGPAVLEHTDNDGRPVIVHRWRRFDCQIVCSTDFASASFEHSHEVNVLDDNFDDED